MAQREAVKRIVERGLLGFFVANAEELRMLRRSLAIAGFSSVCFSRFMSQGSLATRARMMLNRRGFENGF